MIFLLPIDYILQRYKFFSFLLLISTKYSPNTKNDVYRSRLRPIEQPKPRINGTSSYVYRKRIIHLKMLAKCLINPNIQNNGKLSTSSCLFHIKIILRLHTTKLPTHTHPPKDTFLHAKKSHPGDSSFITYRFLLAKLNVKVYLML